MFGFRKRDLALVTVTVLAATMLSTAGAASAVSAQMGVVHKQTSALSPAQFSAYGTGSELHLDTLNAGVAKLAHVDQAFSSNTVSSGGLGGVITSPITGTVVQTDQTANNADSYGRGSGFMAGLGLTPGQVNQVQLGIAEAHAPPPAALITKSAMPLNVPGLFETGQLTGGASATSSRSCATGQALAFAEGISAPPAVVGPSPPLVSDSGAPGSQSAQSVTHTDVFANVDGTFGIQNTVQEIVTPVTVNLGTNVTLAVIVEGDGPNTPFTVTTSNDGEGHSGVSFANNDPIVKVDLTIAGSTQNLADVALSSLAAVLNPQLANGSTTDIALSRAGVRLSIGVGAQTTLPGAPAGSTSVADDLLTINASLGLPAAPPGTPLTVTGLRIGHVESEVTLLGGPISCAAPPRVPGQPQNVSVVPFNGGADVKWSQPVDVGGAPIISYKVEAEPYAPSVNETTPPSSAQPARQTMPAGVTSAHFDNLAADCHTSYVFKVSAVNIGGIGPAGSSPPARTSGIVSTSTPPKLVIILADGEGSVLSVPHPSPRFNPLSVASYCPEGPDGGPPQLPVSIAPALNKWNFDGGSAPQDLSTGAYTHRYLLDNYAAYGAVIVPYSYRGAELTTSGQFVVNPYSASDSQSARLDTLGYYLHKEARSIHSVWPGAKILVFGHSYGGLVALYYWQTSGKGASDGVSHIFSLDSPLNGVRNCASDIADYWACSMHAGSYLPILFSYLWSIMDSHDQTVINTDLAGSFYAIGTDGDSAYTIADTPESGLLSQLMFTGCSGFHPTCNPATPPDILSPCSITPSVDKLVNGDHFVVKYCPGVITRVQQIAPPR